jgi:muconolactone delta-isomerase
MEYLVTMTTHVPDGAPEDNVADVRAREAARSHQLTAEGHLLRLWRPPLAPGEWRTLGLFAAEDDGQLEDILASMPLRVWRTDEVTPLQPHPNDPAPGSGTVPRPGVEFLVDFTTTVPEGTPAQTVEDAKSREAERAHELAKQGHLVRLWVPLTGPTDWRAVGLWRAQDAPEMQAILQSLPLYAWLTAATTQLAPHPSDPAILKA